MVHPFAGSHGFDDPGVLSQWGMRKAGSVAESVSTTIPRN